MADIPPLKALVTLARCLRHAQTDQEREALIVSMKVARLQISGSRESQAKPPGLSALAKRILLKCNRQTLNVRTIAHVCGKTPGGGTIKRAIRELVTAGHAHVVKKGIYCIKRLDSEATGQRAATGRANTSEVEKTEIPN